MTQKGSHRVSEGGRGLGKEGMRIYIVEERDFLAFA